MLKLGLRVEELDGDTVSRALAFRQQRPALSLPDAFALALAQAHAWMLLTGDGGLRTLANHEGVECHGVLWLIDRLHEAATTTAKHLHAGLTAISTHPRCRLPKTETRQRLELYASMLYDDGS